VGVVWKQELHTGDEYGGYVSTVVWEGERGSISGAHRAEVGLHYQSESSSMQRMVQTQRDNQEISERVRNMRHETWEAGGRNGDEGSR